MSPRSRRRTNLFESTLESNTATTPPFDSALTPTNVNRIKVFTQKYHDKLVESDDEEDVFVASAIPPSKRKSILPTLSFGDSPQASDCDVSPQRQSSGVSAQSNTPLSKDRRKRMTMHATKASVDEDDEEESDRLVVVQPLGAPPEEEVTPVVAKPKRRQNPRTLFADVVAFIDVLMDNVDYSSTIGVDIERGGGVWAKRFNSSVTHFVFDNGRTVNWERAKKMSHKFEWINSLWVLDCSEENCRKPTGERLYVARYIPPEEDLMQYLGSTKRKYIRKIDSLQKLRTFNLHTPQTRKKKTYRKLLDSAGPSWRRDEEEKEAPTVYQRTESSGQEDNDDTAPESTANSSASLFTHVNRKRALDEHPQFDRPPSPDSVTVGQPFTRVVDVARGRRRSVTTAMNTSPPGSADLRAAMGDMKLGGGTKKGMYSTKELAKRLFASNNSSTSSLNMSMSPLIRVGNRDMSSSSSSLSTPSPVRRSTRISSQLFLLSTNRASLNVAQQGRPSAEEFLTTPQRQLMKRRALTHDRRRNVVLSNMDEATREKCVKLVGGMTEYKITPTVTADTSHLIIEDDHPSLNVLFAIAYGCYIVSAQWLTDSVEANQWLVEQPYEVQLFNAAMPRRQNRERTAIIPSIVTSEHIGRVFVAESTAEFEREDIARFVELIGLSIVPNIDDAVIVVSEEVPHGVNDEQTVLRCQWIIGPLID